MPKIKAHATPTRERLYKSQRIALMGGSAAADFKLSDLSEYALKPVTIERFYPQTMEAKVKFISKGSSGVNGSTTNSTASTQIAKIMSPALSADVLDTCIFEGTPEIDPENNRNSIVPLDENITGVVEAVNGDSDGNGYILLGYTHSSEDGIVLITESSRIIRYKDSEIILKEGQIEINSPKIIINGTDVTNNLNGEVIDG